MNVVCQWQSRHDCWSTVFWGQVSKEHCGNLHGQRRRVPWLRFKNPAIVMQDGLLLSNQWWTDYWSAIYAMHGTDASLFFRSRLEDSGSLPIIQDPCLSSRILAIQDPRHPGSSPSRLFLSPLLFLVLAILLAGSFRFLTHLFMRQYQLKTSKYPQKNKLLTSNCSKGNEVADQQLFEGEWSCWPATVRRGMKLLTSNCSKGNEVADQQLFRKQAWSCCSASLVSLHRRLSFCRRGQNLRSRFLQPSTRHPSKWLDLDQQNLSWPLASQSAAWPLLEAPGRSWKPPRLPKFAWVLFWTPKIWLPCINNEFPSLGHRLRLCSWRLLKAHENP